MTNDKIGTPIVERIRQRIAVFRDQTPDEDETWESWYFAAFDLLSAEVAALAAPSAGYEVAA